MRRPSPSPRRRSRCRWGKEGKETKEKERKEGKERKEIKERKEGKEDFEGLAGIGREPAAGLGQPFGRGAALDAAEEQGRAFISSEERPAVGERALRGGGKERE